jgi:hypothetical protein
LNSFLKVLRKFHQIFEFTKLGGGGGEKKKRKRKRFCKGMRGQPN